MNENLIVEDNTIYEIDPECLRKKRERQKREESCVREGQLKQEESQRKRRITEKEIRKEKL